MVCTCLVPLGRGRVEGRRPRGDTCPGASPEAACVSLRKSVMCQARSRALTTPLFCSHCLQPRSSLRGGPACPIRGKATGGGQAASPADRALPMVPSLHLVHFFFLCYKCSQSSGACPGPSEKWLSCPCEHSQSLGPRGEPGIDKAPRPGPRAAGPPWEEGERGSRKHPRPSLRPSSTPLEPQEASPERALQKEAAAVSDRP